MGDIPNTIPSNQLTKGGNKFNEESVLLSQDGLYMDSQM